MKIRPLFLLVLLSIFTVAAFADGAVSGQLLKSNGKPLPYTEIELVPLGSKRLVNNPKVDEPRCIESLTADEAAADAASEEPGPKARKTPRRATPSPEEGQLF